MPEIQGVVKTFFRSGIRQGQVLRPEEVRERLKAPRIHASRRSERSTWCGWPASLLILYSARGLQRLVTEAPHVEQRSSRQKSAHAAREDHHAARENHHAAREDRACADRACTAREDRACAASRQAVARSRLTPPPASGSAQGLYRLGVLVAFVGGALEVAKRQRDRRVPEPNEGDLVRDGQ